MNLWATKSIAALRAEAEHTRRALAEPRARRTQPHHAGHRRHHRGRHLRADRHRRRAARRARRRAVIHRRRGCLRPGRPLLRRDGQHRARGRERLHLLLRHHGRVRRLDHRVGPGPGIRHGSRHRRGGLVRLSGEPARLLRAASSHRGHLGPASLVQRRRRHQQRRRLRAGGLEQDRFAVQPAGGVHRAGGHLRSWSSASRNRPRSTT